MALLLPEAGQRSGAVALLGVDPDRPASSDLGRLADRAGVSLRRARLLIRADAGELDSDRLALDTHDLAFAKLYYDLPDAHRTTVREAVCRG